MIVAVETIDSIENFDDLAKEHWDSFNNKKPAFKKEFLRTGKAITARDIKVVGYLIFFTFNSPYYDEKWCQVDMYYIQPKFRKQGIGRKMFTLLEQQAKEQGCSRIISSFNLKQPLDKFYTSIGYERTHIAVAKEI
jgi:GNAT superfamily N-acetyltransferase